MTITYEEVILLCNKYLKAIIPGSTGHHPIFNGIEGGVALTKRLYKVLRDAKYSHLVQGNSLNILEAFKIAEELLRTKKKVYIVGLNHWFKLKDLELIKSIYQKYFIK